MNAPVEGFIELERSEVIRLGAVDSEFFNRTFFPKTFRQASPAFHQEVADYFDNPHLRYVGLKMFRGSAKTTLVRANLAKRISYGISRTVVIVGNSQGHAAYSLRWLSKQMKHNLPWSSFFRLVPGDVWREGEHIEIINETLGTRTNLVALGITGQIRGINLDDYRPDFICADDIDNEETTATAEQRAKTSDLMGSLEKALAPPTECAWAKMVEAQTPINLFDYISVVSKDPGWTTAIYSCFDEAEKSIWEDRYPTAFLRKEKERHVRLHKLSLWMREMECKVVASEKSSFKAEWLKFYEPSDLPAGGHVRLAIDPASSAAKTADDQVLIAVKVVGKDVYVLDYTDAKGENPEQLTFNFFRFIREYQPRVAKVETVAYQKTLKWYLEKRMREMRIWLHLEPVDDKRKKSDRIIQNLGELAAHGHLYVKPSQVKLIQQFSDYAPDVEMHDDVLDALAMAIQGAIGSGNYIDAESLRVEEESYPALTGYRSCP